MQPQHGRQVHLGQDVAVEDDHRVRERVAGVAHRAAGPERRRLDDVANLEADFSPVAEHVLDAAGLVVQAEDDLVDLRHLLQQIDLVVQERPVEDRHDRFRRVERERTEPGALAPGEQNHLHDNLRSYPIGRASGSSTRTGGLQCRKRPMNLPNSLSVTRIFLVPLLVVVLLTKFEGHAVLGLPTPLIGAAIFGLASFTDWLDGYLARRRGQVTSLGRMMDPIADKLLTSAAFISLVQLGLAPAWIVAVIIGRELAITGLRSLASARGVGFGASALGKIKMASQVTTILLLILGQRRAAVPLAGTDRPLAGAADGVGLGGRVLPELPGRAGWPGVDLRLRSRAAAQPPSWIGSTSLARPARRWLWRPAETWRPASRRASRSRPSSVRPRAPSTSPGTRSSRTPR